MRGLESYKWGQAQVEVLKPIIEYIVIPCSAVLQQLLDEMLYMSETWVDGVYPKNTSRTDAM